MASLQAHAHLGCTIHGTSRQTSTAKMLTTVHASCRSSFAVPPYRSTRPAPAQRQAVASALIPDRSGSFVATLSLLPALQRGSSNRSIACQYRPDNSAEDAAADHPSASAPEAAAYNELAADAAAQAAVEQLETAIDSANSSTEPDEPSPAAAASADRHAPGVRHKHSHHQDKHHHPQKQQHSSSSSSKREVAAEGSEPTPSQKLQARLDDMCSQYQALDSRLDSLENTLITLLSNVKERSRKPAAAAGVGPGGVAAATNGGAPIADAAADDVPDFSFDDDDEHGGGLFDLKKLQTSLSENINKGYLESVKHLREMLMAYEWHLHGKELAERKGVAAFEKHCAEKDIEIDFDVLTQLYSNPNDLSILPSNKLKLLARSIIQHAVDERYCNIYFECTNTAKELAKTGLKDIIPDSAGKVGGVIKDILPVPGFLKR